MLDLPIGGGAKNASPSGRDRIPPESLSKKNHEGDPHADRTDPLRPWGRNPRVRYYGPWMTRQSDAFTAAFQVLGQSGSGWSLVLEVQTKNQEDPDSAASALPNTVTVTTANSTSTVSNKKAKELVRCCLICTGGERIAGSTCA